MGMLETFNELRTTYIETSMEGVEKLMAEIGVPFKTGDSFTTLLETLRSKGFDLITKDYVKKEKSVGQYIILEDLDGNFLSGYDTWIQFKVFTVNQEKLATMPEELLGAF